MGTWCLGDRPETRLGEVAALHYELEQGVTIIGTAEFYGGGHSERLVGRAVKPSACEEIYLVSKVLSTNTGRRRLEQSLDASLKALQTDYLDMYLYHWRGSTPLQGTMDALEAAVAKGKIKSQDVSNFDLEDMQKLLEDTDDGDRHRTDQMLYHLGSRGIKVVLEPYQDERDIPTVAYCPPAQADRLRSGLVDSPAVRQMTQEQDINGYRVLLCFALAQESMVSIPHTGKLAHMKELAACLQIELSDEQLALLNRAFSIPEHRVPLDVE